MFLFTSKKLRPQLLLKAATDFVVGRKGRAKYAMYTLFSPRWLALRCLRYVIDGGACVQCGRMTGLQAHHTTYRNRGDFSSFRGFFAELGDLRMVCGPCHMALHYGGQVHGFGCALQGLRIVAVVAGLVFIFYLLGG